jgi:acyl carrier protein
MSNDVFPSVRALIVEHLGIAQRDVTMPAHLGDDLGADSLDLFSIVLACEETFSIPPILDAESDHLVTVGDLVELVRRKQREAADA